MSDIPKRYEKNSHGNIAQTKFYRTWILMKNRCNSVNSPSYKNYGARGITICERWNTFDWFVEDMYLSFVDFIRKYGEKNTSIDRIDNNKGYYPDNCRWTTKKEQANNRRSNTIIEYNGKKMNLGQWSDETGIKRTTLGMRINNYKWTIEKALTTKSHGY